MNFKLVMQLRKNLMEKLDLEKLSAGANRMRAIEAAVFEELCRLLDPGVQPFKPKKKRCNVIMFVGLQGAGKTTTVTKMASYYKRKGWSVGMVCADTFRAGAYDQLKQNATRAGIEYFGSYTERDPVVAAKQGVEAFKAEKTEIIIVDTSGRHKQEEALFAEMQDVAKAVEPDQVIFVMDATIGQAANEQAMAFKKSVNVGACIMTKLDGNAKGGGALSAVAATQSPILFYGTGEHIEDFDVFEPKKFVQKLLGMGDMEGLAQLMKETIGDKMGDQEEMAKQMTQGIFTMRMMYEQFQNVMKMGPLGKVMEMVPGMSQLMSMANTKGADPNAKIKSYMVMMDSMNAPELDDPEIWKTKTKESRVRRISRGSGRPLREVEELLLQFTEMAKRLKKGLKGLPTKAGAKMTQRNLQQVSSMLPPQMLNQMGGMGALKKMMKEMGPGMGGLGGMMGGAGMGGGDDDDEDDDDGAGGGGGGKPARKGQRAVRKK